MSALIVLFVTFAMVSIGDAAWLPGENVGDAGSHGYFSTANLYSCIASPAFTHYTDAKNGTCPPPEKRRVTPEPMGSPGN
jgi:hypothetical protein